MLQQFDGHVKPVFLMKELTNMHPEYLGTGTQDEKVSLRSIRDNSIQIISYISFVITYIHPTLYLET